ncbi:MAG: alpha/beta hydrolase [bacterium]|nr:alpha/beta hydrolase [bacterium]
MTTAEGNTLYYEHHRPEGESKTTVIISCAFCTTHENWRGQVGALVAAGHPVVLWDQRGHGDSPAPQNDPTWSLENVMTDLAAIADATTPDAPFVATGHSFGGLASLHFAARFPDRVAALVLVGSGPGFKNPEAAEGWAAQVERTASFLETRGFEDFVNGRAGITCIGSKPELPAAQAAAKAIIAQSVPGIARFGREISATIPPVIDELADIAVPALVLVGEDDKPYRRAGEVMSAKLQNARHVVVPDAGHIVNIEQPDVFEREVLGFLAELEGA